MTNTPLENILPAEKYIISLFIALTNSLLIYSLIYGKNKYMTKKETTAPKPATKKLSSQVVPIEKPSSTVKNI